MCSPNNYLWLNKGEIQGYPLCNSWCLQWYNACKNVPTCTENGFLGAFCPPSNETNCNTYQVFPNFLLVFYFNLKIFNLTSRLSFFYRNDKVLISVRSESQFNFKEIYGIWAGKEAFNFCVQFFDSQAITVIDEDSIFDNDCVNPRKDFILSKLHEIYFNFYYNKKMNNMWNHTLNDPTTAKAFIISKQEELKPKNQTIPIFECIEDSIEWWIILIIVLGSLILIATIAGGIYKYCQSKKVFLI